MADEKDRLGEKLREKEHAEEERFFSYRRSCLRGEPDFGRGLSAIVLER